MKGTQNIILILSAIAVCCCISCATILNKKTEKIQLCYDNAVIKKAYVENASITNNSNNTFRVKRGKEPVTISVKDSGLQKNKIMVRSRLSPMFWASCWGLYMGNLFAAVDFLTDKKWGYPSKIFLVKKDSTILVNPFLPPSKGTIRANFSLTYPVLSWVYLQNSQPLKNFTGIAGETSVEYFYNKKYYLSASLGGSYNGNLGHTNNGERRNVLLSWYAAVRNNYNIKKWDVGYGLQYSNLYYRKIPHRFFSSDSLQYASLLGLSITTQYALSNRFGIKIIYHPSFLSFQNGINTWQYNHFISFNFSWFPQLRRRLEKQNN